MFCLYIHFDKLLVIVFYPFTDSYSSAAVFIEVSFYSYMYYGLILPVYWLKTSSIDSKGTKTSLTLGIASCFYGKLLSVYSFLWSSNEMTYNTWWTPHSRGLTSENLSTALLMNHLNFIRKNPPLNAFFHFASHHHDSGLMIREFFNIKKQFSHLNGSLIWIVSFLHPHFFIQQI